RRASPFAAAIGATGCGGFAGPAAALPGWGCGDDAAGVRPASVLLRRTQRNATTAAQTSARARMPAARTQFVQCSSGSCVKEAWPTRVESNTGVRPPLVFSRPNVHGLAIARNGSTQQENPRGDDSRRV